jgi:hypothetical protein
MGAGGFMRIDWYTKGVLTVIAVLLGVIALRPYVSPDAVAHAQGSLSGVQVWYGDVASPKFFDPRTGDVWGYSTGKPESRYRLTGVGAPLVKEK